jgi:dienelactone hydrolase
MPSFSQQSTASRSGQRLLRGAFVLTLLVLSGLLVYLRLFRFPAPTGPYPVGTTILDLTDQSRADPFSSDPASRREVVVQLWYPAAPSSKPWARYMRWREAGLAHLYAPLLRTHSRQDAPVAAGPAPFPVLLFSHRWNGQRTQNTTLAEDLASHGYVVASIDHPGNAARVLLADGKLVRGSESLEGPQESGASVEERIAFWNRSLRLWAADSHFVLDRLAQKSADAADRFYGHLDTAHAGAFGHSFGGATALALCGPGAGGSSGTSDPRIQAALNLDGWTFGGLRERTAAQQVLLLYEDLTRDRERELTTLPQPGSADDQLDRADFAATEASLRRYGGYRLFVAGTQHMDFTDEPLLPPFRRLGYTGPIAPGEDSRILRQIALQFFDQALRGQSAPLLVPGRRITPALTVEHWPAPVSGSPPQSFTANPPK